jgi:monolysocardiolipin acyltransferase
MAAGGGAPWAEGARVVGTQIRNRFRVAPVDRRWLWRRADGRTASEAVRRWSDRVLALVRRDWSVDQSCTSQATSPDAAAKSSSSAMRFYRRKGLLLT